MDSENQGGVQDFFTPEKADDAETTKPESVSWSASEFLHHQKSASWYLTALLAMVVLSGVFYLLTRDLIGPISVMVLGALLLVGAGRKPRTIEYVVDPHGIVVGRREYLYDDFQSFAVIQEDQVEYISLYPQKRFAPEITMYFSPDDGQKIFDILSDFLPFEQRDRDTIDKFLHRIKF